MGNTTTLMEMMDQIDKIQVRCAVLESKAAASSGLINRVKALEDRSAGAAFRIAMEDRMKALEDFQATKGPSSGLSVEWESGVEERIFALEQRAVTMPAYQSTDPFEVIEDFKRKMAASGFRGTLTLDIE